MKNFTRLAAVAVIVSAAAFTLTSCSCSCTPRGCSTSKKIKITEPTISMPDIDIPDITIPTIDEDDFFGNKETKETKETQETKGAKVKGTEVEKSYGRYTVSDKWEYAENHSNNTQDFYCPKGETNAVQPNNIFVRYDTCPYSKDQADLFKRAILEQIGMEKHKPDKITSSGSETAKGNILLTFNMSYPEGSITHYYIVGEKEFVLVSEAVYDEDSKDEADEVAKGIIDSFEFN